MNETTNPHPALTEADHEAIANRFIDKLDRRRKISEETHHKHHQFIDELLETRCRRRQRWEAIRRHVIGWTIISVLSGIGLAVWRIFERWVHPTG